MGSCKTGGILKYNTRCHTWGDDILGSLPSWESHSFGIIPLVPYSSIHTYSISCSYGLFSDAFSYSDTESNGWITNWTGRNVKRSCRNLILRNISKFACWHSGRPRKSPVRIVGFKPGTSFLRSRNIDCEFPLQHFAHYAGLLLFSNIAVCHFPQLFHLWLGSSDE